MIEALPEATRHLAVHDLHLVGVSEHDRPFLGPELLAGVAFTPAQVRDRSTASPSRASPRSSASRRGRTSTAS